MPAITASKKFSRNSDMVTGFFASVNQPDFGVQRKSRCKIGAIQAGIANAVSEFRELRLFESRLGQVSQKRTPAAFYFLYTQITWHWGPKRIEGFFVCYLF